MRHNHPSPKIPKNAIKIDTSHCTNCIFLATPGLSLSIKISNESLSPVNKDSVEKPLILILASKSWLFNIPRKFLLEKIVLEDQNGSVTTSLISFMKVTISNLTLRGESLIQTAVSWFLYQITKFRPLPKFENFRHWIMSIFNLKIVHNYRLKFFQQDVNRKLEAHAVLFS